MPEKQELVLPLDPRLRERWVELSRLTQVVATGARPSSINHLLEEETAREPSSPVAPAYRLWAAENLSREGRYEEALKIYDLVLEVDQSAEGLLGLDFGRSALHHKAGAAARAGRIDLAITTCRELAEGSGNPAEAFLEAGRFAEEAGRSDEAAALYRRAAESKPSGLDSAEDKARRALLRMQDARTPFFAGVAKLTDLLTTAVETQDPQALRGLASRTHFAAGPAGGHLVFEDDTVLDHLCAELAARTIRVEPHLLGQGAKRYLFTRGWQGLWFRDRVGFALVHGARGWQWTGVLLTVATDPWRERWMPRNQRTNQPLPLELLAPWPASERFTAGGLEDFALKSAAVLAAGIFGPIVAEGFSLQDCGYGTRGFYYNEGPTHQDEDAFAIDFTRYRRGVPFDNESGGTPVLAAADGLVVTACGGTSSGDDSASNTVEIQHPDPTNGQPRFLSRYLHLAGPNLLSVSMGMAIATGERVGLMNDTGNSALDHLHFSIHDQNVPFPGAGSACSGITRGTSVRPTPIDGEILADSDSGKCVLSSNLERNLVRAATGRITMLRAHELGTGFGPPGDSLDAEVIVFLDSQPGEFFGLSLRSDEHEPSRRSMVALLRDAFANDAVVRLEFQRTGRSGRRILRAQRTD
jgi:murein DD-endopeptidase MepM/ murein hydrolase activator NlpD